jgi:hypothetical protein
MISFRNSLALIAIVAVLAGALHAQVVHEEERPMGLPQDWSHNHELFTNLASPEAAIASQSDVRLLHNWLARNRGLLQQGTPIQDRFNEGEMPVFVRRKHAAKVDWSISLGTGNIAQNQYPAKYSFNINATPDCVNDFVVFGLNVLGVTAGQANMLALNQLYRGSSPTGLCGTGSAAVMWAYNTSTIALGVVRTSPVLSLDGTKVAFVESGSVSSIFHVLKWATGAGNGTSATNSAVPGIGNSASMTSLIYAPTATNTRSSPFVDYKNDVGYIGANDGKLYKITGVFDGTPALAGAPWPVTISAGLALTAPIFDSVSGKIFIGDSNGVLKSVLAATGTLSATTLTVGSTGLGGGIVDPPIVDSTNGTVFAFSGNDGTGAVVVQANTALTQLARGSVGRGGASGTAINLHAGAFSNGYFSTPSTGFLYVCGTLNSGNARPALYRFGFTGTTLNTAGAGGPLQIGNTSPSECSPTTEFFNSNTTAHTDTLFLGITTDCVTGGAGGCIDDYNITGAMPTAALNGVGETGGTSGIVVDNVSTSAQASSVYFSTLGATHSAIKLTQSGLQ